MFYLYQDHPRIRHIKEESFFDILVWAHCAISGLFVSVCAGENFYKFNESPTQLVSYSSCSKIPIIWEQEMVSWSYIVNMIVHSLVLPLAFYTQYMLFKKHNQLVKQRTEGIMVVTYHQDNVTIQKRSPDEKTIQKLTNFHRTVVTPKASFLSFLLLFLYYSLNGYFIFKMGTSGPQVWEQFIINLVLFVHFFFQSLTETIFSPTVLRTLMNVIPCQRRRVYRVVTV